MSTPNFQFLKRFKRKPSSTSSSDGSPEKQSVGNRPTEKPTPKKHCVTASVHSDLDQSIREEEEGEETMTTTLDDLSRKMDGLSTKKDLEDLKEVFFERLLRLEETVAGLEVEKCSLREEVEKVRKENSDLKQKLLTMERKTEKNANDQEQYSRRWNLRIFGLKESAGEDCIEKCLDLFNSKVKVKTKQDDLQVAHRLGRREGGDRGKGSGRQSQQRAGPRTVIVQFASRRVRDQIIMNRRILAGSGLTIAEDLTVANFQLLKRAQEHSATKTAWPSNGKIIAQLNNGKKVKVEVDTDLDKFFASQGKG